MRRTLASACFLVGVACNVVIGCDSSSKSSPPVDPCAYGDCGEGGSFTPDASSRVDASRRDASAVPADATSGAVFDFDATPPPLDAADAQPDVRIPIDAVVVRPPEERAVCTNTGVVGFSTQALTLTGPPGDPTPTTFGPRWAAAAQRTGAPGPALVILGDFATMPDGATRSLRIGAPRTTSGGAPFGFLQVVDNPLTFPWAPQSEIYFSGSSGTAAQPQAKLRFKAASGANVDVPVAGAMISGTFDYDTNQVCTGLAVRALTFYVPTSAAGLAFEDGTLGGFLGPANATLGGQNAYWRIMLQGNAPAVALQGAP